MSVAGGRPASAAAASCAVCACALAPGADVCPRCGARATAPAAATPAATDLPTLLAGGVRAPAAARVGAAVIDVLVGAAVAAPLVLGAARVQTAGGQQLVVVGVVLLATYLAATVAGQATTGRTLGKLALGLRTVDVLTGLPLGLQGSPADRWGRAVVLDVRAGRDPFASVADVVLQPLAQVAAAGFAGSARPSAPAASATRADSSREAPHPTAPDDGSTSASRRERRRTEVGEARSAPATAGTTASATTPAVASADAGTAESPAVPPQEPSRPVAERPVAERAVAERPVAERAARTPEPPAPAPTPSRAAPARETVVIALDDGQRFELRGVALVGRNPHPVAGEHVDLLVPLNDLSRSVSKTHASLRWDGRLLWVADRGSTNGTAVIDGSGERVAVTTAEERAAAPGARVEVGNRSFLVEPAGGPA